MILGDSLSAAHNIKIQDSWPYLLQQKFDQQDSAVQIINASISGETTFGGKNRIKALLNTHQPDLLILELGGNDGLRGLSFDHSEQNLRSIIQNAKQNSSQVILVGVRLPPNLGPVYNAAFQQLFIKVQQAEQVAYLPTFLKGVAEDSSLMQNDGIHPVEKAQPILMDKVYLKIQSINL